MIKKISSRQFFTQLKESVDNQFKKLDVALYKLSPRLTRLAVVNENTIWAKDKFTGDVYQYQFETDKSNIILSESCQLDIDGNFEDIIKEREAFAKMIVEGIASNDNDRIKLGTNQLFELMSRQKQLKGFKAQNNVDDIFGKVISESSDKFKKLLKRFSVFTEPFIFEGKKVLDISINNRINSLMNERIMYLVNRRQELNEKNIIKPIMERALKDKLNANDLEYVACLTSKEKFVVLQENKKYDDALITIRENKGITEKLIQLVESVIEGNNYNGYEFDTMLKDLKDAYDKIKVHPYAYDCCINSLDHTIQKMEEQLKTGKLEHTTVTEAMLNLMQYSPRTFPNQATVAKAEFNFENVADKYDIPNPTGSVQAIKKEKRKIKESINKLDSKKASLLIENVETCCDYASAESDLGSSYRSLEDILININRFLEDINTQLTTAQISENIDKLIKATLITEANDFNASFTNIKNSLVALAKELDDLKKKTTGTSNQEQTLKEQENEGNPDIANQSDLGQMKLPAEPEADEEKADVTKTPDESDIELNNLLTDVNQANNVAEYEAIYDRLNKYLQNDIQKKETLQTIIVSMKNNIQTYYNSNSASMDSTTLSKLETILTKLDETLTSLNALKNVTSTAETKEVNAPSIENKNEPKQQ